MTDRELMIDCPRCGHCCSQPEQEPVAWYDKHGMVTHDPFEGIRPLYAAPRPWVGLTDEDIFSVLTNLQEMYNRPPTTDSRVIFAYAIEAKLKEKNT